MKYLLGVSKSCPNLSHYGETGEIPLSLKGYRLMINFWHRVTNLPENTLAKKALLENIVLRSNWIKTIEKLLGYLQLTDAIENPFTFKRRATSSIHLKFTEFWGKRVSDGTSSRLQFYKTIKNKFEFENYLTIYTYESWKAISKIRCSDHPLEVKRGDIERYLGKIEYANYAPPRRLNARKFF